MLSFAILATLILLASVRVLAVSWPSSCRPPPHNNKKKIVFFRFFFSFFFQASSSRSSRSHHDDDDDDDSGSTRGWSKIYAARGFAAPGAWAAVPLPGEPRPGFILHARGGSITYTCDAGALTIGRLVTKLFDDAGQVIAETLADGTLLVNSEHRYTGTVIATAFGDVGAPWASFSLEASDDSNGGGDKTFDNIKFVHRVATVAERPPFDDEFDDCVGTGTDEVKVDAQFVFYQ